MQLKFIRTLSSGIIPGGPCGPWGPGGPAGHVQSAFAVFSGSCEGALGLDIVLPPEVATLLVP